MLKAANLGLRADGHWLWQGLNLQLASGTRLGIRGRSGSGKSSLLRCLAGLIAASEGSIQYRNKSLCDQFMPAYRAEVMYLPADPLVLPGTVADNLRAPFALQSHTSRQFDETRVLTLLTDLGREQEFLQRNTNKLSSGERQTLALVRALQLEPTLLLLDEATASLDPDSELRAESALKQWLGARPDRGWAMVSHSAQQLQRMCNEQLEIAGG